MTNEDLHQIRAILREEIASTEQRMLERLDRAVEAMTTNLSESREEMRRRFEAIELHLDRIDTRLGAISLELSGISKARDATERLDREMLAVQSAQQRAIDDLARRVTSLEQALGGAQQVR